MNKFNDMELHDILTRHDYEILRVEGGWIYTRFSESGTGGYIPSACFVPYDNEFQGKEG